LNQDLSETPSWGEWALRPSLDQGATVSNKSLTIVLPVYNSESRLTHHVTEVLELASELTSQFEVMIVDDGSTDETSAVAEELATRYPQISIRRHRHRRGLGPIISMVQKRVCADVVIVHDGVTPINCREVRRLWQQSTAESDVTSSGPSAQGGRHGVQELAEIRTTQTAMALAHARVLGFHLLQPLKEGDDASSLPVDSRTPPPHAKPRTKDGAGVGQIPLMPRPNFLSSVADFALGE
jgi:glycosyltransferase involved in cell wall biosynthesis